MFHVRQCAQWICSVFLLLLFCSKAHPSYSVGFLNPYPSLIAVGVKRFGFFSRHLINCENGGDFLSFSLSLSVNLHFGFAVAAHLSYSMSISATAPTDIGGP